jgi:hypothetical protein
VSCLAQRAHAKRGPIGETRLFFRGGWIFGGLRFANPAYQPTDIALRSGNEGRDFDLDLGSEIDQSVDIEQRRGQLRPSVSFQAAAIPAPATQAAQAFT